MKFGELEHVSDEELRRLYDVADELTVYGVAFWREEIAYRRAERQTAAIVRMTGVMLALTIVVAVCTVVLVIRS